MHWAKSSGEVKSEGEGGRRVLPMRAHEGQESHQSMYVGASRSGVSKLFEIGH
jgi:hypothetical protein